MNKSILEKYSILQEQGRFPTFFYFLVLLIFINIQVNLYSMRGKTLSVLWLMRSKASDEQTDRQTA